MRVERSGCVAGWLKQRLLPKHTLGHNNNKKIIIPKSHVFYSFGLQVFRGQSELQSESMGVTARQVLYGNRQLKAKLNKSSML